MQREQAIPNGRGRVFLFFLQSLDSASDLFLLSAFLRVMSSEKVASN